jgi:hypothetical protein
VNLITHNRLGYPTFAREQIAAYQETRTGMLTNYGGDVLGISPREERDSQSED